MLFIYCILIVITPLTSSKQYRTDYVYNKKTDAFYKLHIESRDRWRAAKVCQAEGAELMDPDSDLDVAQFHVMFKRYPDLGNYAWVQDDGQAHADADEKIFVMGETESPEAPWYRRCDVLTRDGEIEKYRCAHGLPFICKVQAKATYFDETCNVYGKNYQYFQDVDSCYKVSEIAYTWNEAYAECGKEGSHLVVLNSEAEDQIVWNLLKQAPFVPDAKAHFFFFAGFRARKSNDDKPRVFRTIFNQTLEEAGFAQWSENEPNNALNSEECGSIFKNDGKLNDLDCSHTFAFICEKEKHFSIPSMFSGSALLQCSNMIVILYVFLACTLKQSFGGGAFFRKDYVFNKQTDAYYKLHIESRNYRGAEKVCEAEGAKLMQIESDQDIVQFHGMIKMFPDVGLYAWVATDKQEHEEAEDQKVIVMGEEEEYPQSRTLCDMVARNGELYACPCYRGLPFICKVKSNEAYYDSTCDVYGKQYQYMENTGSCYKISDIALTWNGAYGECQAEGSHLVVLNSELEHQVVWNLTRDATTSPEAKVHWFLLAGFRANHPDDGTPRVFKTIFNQTLEEAGYSQWSENEPNNSENNEYCGSIFKNDGKLNDVDCSHLYSFVCEKERKVKT
ncbi:macrophage mannose receptor 1 [Amyelois transitella]|uniref:macrophage mannose receptor 1 n=1 Tax=Amyelois transitella TaxID=680683 RepID=UPI002990638B|nr:macrophage mannose receptor 1 [Amyelois transitella]